MTFVNVQLHDFFKKLIQSLIRMSYQQSSLLGPIMVNIGNYLNSNVRFTRTRRSDNLRITLRITVTHEKMPKNLKIKYHRQTGLHARFYGFNLYGSESN